MPVPVPLGTRTESLLGLIREGTALRGRRPGDPGGTGETAFRLNLNYLKQLTLAGSLHRLTRRVLPCAGSVRVTPAGRAKLRFA